MSYYSSKLVNIPFDEAEVKVSEALKNEGFGILTEIDVQSTLKKKLDVDFRRYKILGACNPPFAYKALQAEDKIGLLLPCNLIIQETAFGSTEVAVINPMESMRMVKNDKLVDVAEMVQLKLKKVLESI